MIDDATDTELAEIVGGCLPDENGNSPSFQFPDPLAGTKLPGLS